MANELNPSSAALDVMAGPLKGTSFPLAGTETTLGRDPSNAISLLDNSVSRHHCVIAREGAGYKLRDLGSRNSTFVNGVPIKDRLLKSGDEIRVGSSVFIYVPAQDSQATNSSGSVRLSQSRIAASTIILRKEKARYLTREPISELAQKNTRVARDLNVLLRISTSINSLRDMQAIQRQVLLSALDVSPADRVAILLGDNVMALDRKSGEACTIEASQTVVARVLEEGVAILSNDVTTDESFESSQSLIARNIRSVIAVPLEALGQTRGVLYLESSNLGATFDQDLLELLTAFGSIASIAMANAQHLERLADENQRLQEEINIEHNMVGESPRMREVYQFIAKVAPTEATVLVRGESGTGKELVARAIHNNSLRNGKPFVAINCAAITETLLESELFGHEKGSFTGAVAQKKGKLEVAEGGTVFLDEIGEMAIGIQAKLLRVLQERELQRVGGTKTIKLDVRIVAATNRDLQEESKKGVFRQDLYYRLNVVSIRMPALRERREDIPLLASYFASKYAERAKRTIVGLSTEARAYLLNYDWPGNVRELENAIERAVVLGSTTAILPEDLPEAVLEKPAPSGSVVTKYQEGVQEAKKRIILAAIDQAGGHYTEAAKLLGVHPNYLHRLMTNLNLRSPSDPT
ncbi:MAG TPA: sigma 54-interacting transcriptional regulator [Bryobacteraceae bacterium]|nr:sigma 54-interacting transcriptional regulator [Bryobacteraceae bacterium]